MFIVSWVNPDERLSKKTFDDYMEEGPLAAMEAIEIRSDARPSRLRGRRSLLQSAEHKWYQDADDGRAEAQPKHPAQS